MDLQAAIDELNNKGYSLNLYQYTKPRPLWDATAYDRRTSKMIMFGIGATWELALVQLLNKARGEWVPAVDKETGDPFDFEMEEDPLA